MDYNGGWGSGGGGHTDSLAMNNGMYGMYNHSGNNYNQMMNRHPSSVGGMAVNPAVHITGTPAGGMLGAPPMREEMVLNAVKFLEHPSVAKSSTLTRLQFLEKKGMTPMEIAEAMRRVFPASPDTATVLTVAGKGQQPSTAFLNGESGTTSQSGGVAQSSASSASAPAPMTTSPSASTLSSLSSSSPSPASTSAFVHAPLTIPNFANLPSSTETGSSAAANAMLQATGSVDGYGPGVSATHQPGMVQVGPSFYTYPHNLHPVFADHAAKATAAAAAAAAEAANRAGQIGQVDPSLLPSAQAGAAATTVEMVKLLRETMERNRQQEREHTAGQASWWGSALKFVGIGVAAFGAISAARRIFYHTGGQVTTYTSSNNSNGGYGVTDYAGSWGEFFGLAPSMEQQLQLQQQQLQFQQQHQQLLQHQQPGDFQSPTKSGTPLLSHLPAAAAAEVQNTTVPALPSNSLSSLSSFSSSSSSFDATRLESFVTESKEDIFIRGFDEVKAQLLDVTKNNKDVAAASLSSVDKMLSILNEQKREQTNQNEQITALLRQIATQLASSSSSSSSLLSSMSPSTSHQGGGARSSSPPHGSSKTGSSSPSPSTPSSPDSSTDASSSSPYSASEWSSATSSFFAGSTFVDTPPESPAASSNHGKGKDASSKDSAGAGAVVVESMPYDHGDSSEDKSASSSASSTSSSSTSLTSFSSTSESGGVTSPVASVPSSSGAADAGSAAAAAAAATGGPSEAQIADMTAELVAQGRQGLTEALQTLTSANADAEKRKALLPPMLMYLRNAEKGSGRRIQSLNPGFTKLRQHQGVEEFVLAAGFQARGYFYEWTVPMADAGAVSAVDPADFHVCFKKAAAAAAAGSALSADDIAAAKMTVLREAIALLVDLQNAPAASAAVATATAAPISLLSSTTATGTTASNSSSSSLPPAEAAADMPYISPYMAPEDKAALLQEYNLQESKPQPSLAGASLVSTNPPVPPATAALGSEPAALDRDSESVVEKEMKGEEGSPEGEKEAHDQDGASDTNGKVNGQEDGETVALGSNGHVVVADMPPSNALTVSGAVQTSNSGKNNNNNNSKNRNVKGRKDKGGKTSE